MSDLFRREVMEERKVAGLGNVSVMAPPSFAILTAGICAAITALVLFVCLAQFTRKATVAGYLVPDKGLVKVLPPFPGTVVERLVTEGDPVATGDLLYVVVAHRATAETPDVDAALIARVRERRRVARVFVAYEATELFALVYGRCSVLASEPKRHGVRFTLEAEPHLIEHLRAAGGRAC